MIEEDIPIIEYEIQKAINDLKLDLSGLTILTEAASNIFIVTPLIALMAKAKKVYAISQTTQYGTFVSIKKNTQKVAVKMGLQNSSLEIIHKNKFKDYDKVNIITNLGHVRPIDEKILSLLKKDTVISYMCESWEYRPDDLDLKLCNKYGILVYGINEEYPLVNCFREIGLIALKLIFESKISLLDTQIAIISRDKFGITILKTIRQFNKKAILFNKFDKNLANQLNNLDLLIVADYKYPGTIIGSKGIIRPSILKKQSPNVKIIQVCGNNHLKEIKAKAIPVYPVIELSPIRMSNTFGDISYKSIIRLYTGGFKVGEITFKKDFDQRKFRSLIQPIK